MLGLLVSGLTETPNQDLAPAGRLFGEAAFQMDCRPITKSFFGPHYL